MKVHRKLTAIMFTDIVGYTSLMSKNEDIALRILRKNRDIVKLLVDQFNGEMLKEIGDGNLCSFRSVVDAVNCALEIQSTLIDESDYKLRIGVHVGDVVVEESGDVFGDGVNVASRIETLAEPGGVCVSERVHLDIMNKPEIYAECLGEKSLKNVAHSMKIYCLKKGSESVQDQQAVKVDEVSEIKQKPSIAVLPFVDMSPEKDQEWFCDGVSEEIINALVHVEGMHVVARTSSFQFPGKGYDIREIGKQLKVKMVLEGSVRKFGNRIRITAQLINIKDGYHLWSERFDSEMDDIFDIQDEISLAIVDELKVKILKKEKAAIVKRHTDNQEAYSFYLKGRWCWGRRNEGGMIKSVEYFKQAIEADTAYALPYTGIADAYSLMSFFGFLDSLKYYPKAKQAALNALEIDPSLAEAHTSLGWIYSYYDLDWEAAKREYKLAIELNPGYATAHEWYSLYLATVGRTEEAIQETLIAQELDPLSLIINSIVGVIYGLARRQEEAGKNYRKALEMDPDFILALTWFGSWHMENGMYQEAIALLERAVALPDGMVYASGYLGMTYALSGQTDKAYKLLENLQEPQHGLPAPPMNKGLIYLGLGDFDKALEYAEKELKHRKLFSMYFKTQFVWDSFRSDPRFKALLKKMGLDSEDKLKTGG